jgi:hypothetical protein
MRRSGHCLGNAALAPRTDHLRGLPRRSRNTRRNTRGIGWLAASGGSETLAILSRPHPRPLSRNGRGQIIESGWEGIRTPGGLSPTAVFKTAALDHSATHPNDLYSTRHEMRKSSFPGRMSYHRPCNVQNKASRRIARLTVYCAFCSQYTPKPCFVETANAQD